MKVSWTSVLLVSLVMILVSGKTSFAQGETPTPEDRRYFPQTGHFVTGEFLQVYQSIPEPELIYGYPITVVYLDENKNRMIQYFEKARFEFVPENPPELRVQISELGRIMYQPGQSLPTPENFPACRNYPETGRRVCYAFLTFLDDHGGVGQFGYPISNFEIHDHLIVQYFQRARLEYHPELDGERVVVGNLGEQYFTLMDEDLEHKRPEDVFSETDGNNRVQVVLGLNVRAYTEQPVLPQSGQVTIGVTVRDQNLIPVHGAGITLTVTLPSGKQQGIILDPTDENGISKVTFNFANEPLGLAEVRIKATYHDLQKKALTSFRIWR